MWSYVFGSVGLLFFLGTGYFYISASDYVPWWARAVLALVWLALLACAIWLMRMSPGWVLAVPVLSMIALAVVTGLVEWILIFAGYESPSGSG